MKNSTIEMNKLYSEESISNQFSKEEFRHFLQRDEVSSPNGIKQKYRKNDIIILEDEIINDVYFIESGHVASIKGEKQISDFYTSNEILGFTKLLLNAYSEYSYKVISNEVIVTKYTKEYIIDKVFNTQEGYFYHYNYIQNQINRMLEKVNLIRLPSKQRVSLALLQLCSRFGKKTEDPDIICFPRDIGKALLGQYVNLNPNTITNIFQKLGEEEIIFPSRRTFYVNITNLQKNL
ncbi:Crp/Fnr family transcriptional regulator [Listeria rocourtiae]|uniref:Crp/Fnr family transcriptional regulator n=1 Tax=Listeria rocourtiae TaxID=647910 RepID=UPI00162AA8A9|nr:Crp/Fnr family transcriptional regulator [Listeria rocourtiae]MBC1436009.1 Crp/Fnr family transcriptional regulator [Listeria rocourtiae]MBC1605307.1 Crp/Fnr family transcriptional regulator [Listeria rocourtiae]